MFLVYLKGMRGPEPQLVSSLDVFKDVNGKTTDRLLDAYKLPLDGPYVLHDIDAWVSMFPCKMTWPPPYDEPSLVLNSDPGPKPTTPAAQAITVSEPKPADEDYSNAFVDRYHARTSVG